MLGPAGLAAPSPPLTWVLAVDGQHISTAPYIEEPLGDEDIGCRSRSRHLSLLPHFETEFMVVAIIGWMLFAGLQSPGIPVYSRKLCVSLNAVSYTHLTLPTKA